MDKKLVLTFRKILIVLLVLWMIQVFFLSQQNGDQSGSLSHKVSLVITMGNEEKAETIEPTVRKSAHMTEFGFGAMIFYGILLTYPSLNVKGRITFTAMFILIYAGLDELHQTYIVARNGSLWDVAIDSFGGALGIGAMYLLEVMVAVMDNKVKEELENSKQ